MRTPITNTIIWVIRAAVSLAIIVAMLVGYQFLQEEFAKLDGIEREQAALRQALVELEGKRSAFAKEISAMAPNAASPANAVEQKITWLEREMGARQQKRKQFWESDPFGRYNPVSPTFQEIAQIDIELAILKEALVHSRIMHSYVAGPTETRRKIGELSAEIDQLKKRIHDNQYAQWQLDQTKHLEWQIPYTPANKEMNRLEKEETKLKEKKAQVDRDHAREIDKLKAHEKHPAPLQFATSPNLNEPSIKAIGDKLDANDRRQEGSNLSKFFRPIKEQLPTAAVLLVFALLSPLLLKSIAYFLIAPLAQRRPAVRILDQCSGVISTVAPVGNPEPGSAMSSRVSLSIGIDPQSELLVMPSFLHGMPAKASSSTKWLLDWSMPMTSMLAGMYRLMRIRPSEESYVTVSSADDPLAEFSLIEIPEGSALILQPRALVGILQGRERPVRITRHWRITHLNAWLTLQFRYIVFHGPVILVVKGCRGVRVEPVKAERTVNQAATLGFSANLPYTVSRNETFWSYFFGERSLYNDSWTGDGYCVHSETPESVGRSRLFGRGLEGFIDTILKIFGV